MFTGKTHRICEGYDGELICVHVLWCACASLSLSLCVCVCVCVCACACQRSSQDFKNERGGSMQNPNLPTSSV